MDKGVVMNLKNLLAVILLASILSFASCSQKASETSISYKVEHPSWALNATIYEVNIRQYTPEGTFEAFEAHLPRLKELGVNILWLMPIYPIGEVERKGSLGSYYSVKDYKGVNPEFGTMNDFKRLVTRAHEMGFKVILDWVANHTSHDNHLVFDHPEWYVRNDSGKLVSPFDWSDVVQLNYENMELREYMVGALKFWVVEANIDGYRCDVASMVPTEFWNKARIELDKVKPVFMLAEAEEVTLQEFAFDADYGWEFHHVMNGIAKREKSVINIDEYFPNELAKYPKNTIKMHFTSNHDENSWAGTEFTRLGDAAKTFAAISFVIPGIPLIYNGQEVAFNRMLQFFDKDEISWTPNDDYTSFYKILTNLKYTNTALAAGEDGADMVRVKTSNNVDVFAFTRQNNKDKIFAVFNLSSINQQVELEGDDFVGEYTELFTEEKASFEKKATITLLPWQFRIYVK